MTPAYPTLKPSYVEGVMKAEMSLFNYRSDVKYYKIALFDADWINVPFATKYRVLKVKHEERQDFLVYIRKADLVRAVYLCTTSKMLKKAGVKTVISSRICSRVDGARP
tara:strand:- start:1279 stop:1605 length:327 start_codon:yes stop_codon:yes gene_type:complete